MGLLKASRRREPPVIVPRHVDENDQMLIERLRRNGANLIRTRDVRHYLSLPSLLVAMRVVERLESEGFIAEIFFEGQEDPADSRRFVVRASHDLVVTLYAMTELREHLTALAGRWGGEYCGWEGAPQP
jgi:hypothetical protein